MKRATSILIAVFFLALAGVSSSSAEDELVGTVISMSGSRLAVEIRKGDIRRLTVTERTRFYKENAPVHLKRILPHSRVRVAPKNGSAEAIFLLEVPQ